MANITATKELTGAQIFIKCLKEHNTDTVFGYPGAIILSIYEEFYKSSDIKHYLVRHEQAAVHAAEGYARVSEKCGIVLVTSGPGATNTITGLANAYLDEYPLIVFCGQVHSELIGKDAFQEVDIVDIAKPCTKWAYQVKSINELEETIHKAYEIAETGKKGPVLIDIPKDILETKLIQTNDNPPYKKQYEAPQIDKNLIFSALKKLENAKQPIILAGGGVISANASKELTALANLVNAPVTTTMMGIGAYEETNAQNLGMPGVLGNYWANQAICECDILLAIGTRFSDRIINPIKNCSKNAEIIYIDLEPSAFSKELNIGTQIIADAKDALTVMLENSANFNFDKKTNWINEINNKKSKKMIPEVHTGKMNAHKVLEKIYEYTKDLNPIVATEVGQHQLWTVQSFNFTCPRKLVTSGGLGTMGFGFPAAMGACLADKNSLVLNIAGDGSIQMNIQELATCIEYDLPVKVMIMNNGYLGMVRQWQEKLYDKHYCGTEISSPDFVKVAQAYGAKGIRVEKEEEIIPALKEAIDHNGPVFIDFIIEPFDVVYPWVAS